MFKHIIVAVDGSECSGDALEEAVTLAKSLDANLTACSVVDIIRAASSMTYASGEIVQAYFDALRDDAKRVLAQAEEQARAMDVTLDTDLCEGYPADAIVEAAKRHGADLIVMGSHGRTGLRRFLLGSVAESVVRIAAVPVLIVHAHPAGKDGVPSSHAGARTEHALS